MALVLAALLTLSPAAFASQALGTEIHMSTTHLAQGVEYTRQYLWSAAYSDLRTERYIEYSPNTLVRPVVAYGDSILSKKTLPTLAQSLEAAGQRVIGGINGDYFVVATGEPLGMVLTDGVLRSSSSNYYALGFDPTGKAFIGQPELSITATFHGSTYAVSGGLNKVRTETGGLVLYTSDFGPTTKHSSPGIDVILTPVTHRLGQQVSVDLNVLSEPNSNPNRSDPPNWSDLEWLLGPIDSADLSSENVPRGDTTAKTIRDTLVYTDVPTVGGRISCTVQQVLSSEKSIDIPAGSLVLSVNSNSGAWLTQALSSLRPGDTVDVDITSPDERWERAVTAIGGLYKLVSNGIVESGLDASQAPRSAVGIRPDGSTVFYTIDGRQSGYSVGASIEQVAQRLVELGCVEAVCMDGGGSTTLGVSRPGEDSFALMNRPSDGSARAVTNALFLVADRNAGGLASRLAISPGDAMILAGSQVELSAISVNNLGQLVNKISPNQVTYMFSGGSVQNGILHAGSQPGNYTLTAHAGGLTGDALITVVDTPAEITLYDEVTGVELPAVHLEPGGTLELAAGAFYCNLPLYCSDRDFTWSVSDGVGTIDENGTLKAGPANATGTITLTSGKTSVSFPVTVSGYIHTVETFEGDFLHMTGSPAAQITPESNLNYVRFGRQSGKLSYDTQSTAFGEATWLPLLKDEKYLSMWVYGDSSGNTLIAPVQLRDGSILDETVTTLNFAGWQQVVFPLPAGAKQVLALKVASTGSIAQGTIWLDQVTSSNQIFPDDSAPAISVALTPAVSEQGTYFQIDATVTDNMGQSFTADDLSVSYDGMAMEFTVTKTGLSAALPLQDSMAHRITVTATDASGNIGRASADIGAVSQGTSFFSDVDNHWSKSYVNYLYDQKITTGVAVGDTFVFQPEKNVSRGEFALMVARWLRLDLTQYTNVQLPFADTDQIPTWCLDAMKAMYAMGVIQGSGGAGGKLYANAGNSISRAEAMTMLGRVQGKGFASAELTFSDAGTIPSWSKEYVSTMVAQGVINGYNGALSPNTYIKRGEMAKILYALR